MYLSRGVRLPAFLSSFLHYAGRWPSWQAIPALAWVRLLLDPASGGLTGTSPARLEGWSSSRTQPCPPTPTPRGVSSPDLGCVLVLEESLSHAGTLSRRSGFDPWVGKFPWRRSWQPTPVFWPGESHGLRSLVGYSPWGCRESDTTEQALAGWL